ncbi:hypothetical protein [Paenibacillus medicaginis]|uniref:Uncharacterized protein n=1 Tax=Paenibacillus medicaginis TaxID=1470560 RepID=A0ABV5C115_9BACL
MTQVKGMTDQQLNIAIEVLLGAKVDRVRPGNVLMGNYSYTARNYSGDPAASLEVQAAACKVNPKGYIRNLGTVQNWAAGIIISATEAARLVTATPRQRAEAAYMTLSQVKESSQS